MMMEETMKNQHNRLGQWFVLRLWHLRCRWHGRRLTPGTRVRLVSAASTFQGMTGVIVETNDSLPSWRLVVLDDPVRRGGDTIEHVTSDTISLTRVETAR
jgi:hypothetical protein